VTGSGDACISSIDIFNELSRRNVAQVNMWNVVERLESDASLRELPLISVTFCAIIPPAPVVQVLPLAGV
jgi:hypothetical protein